jgi:flagellar motor protein MotB
MFKKLLVIILLFSGCTYADIQFPDEDRLENMFRANLPADAKIIYTEVPRGLVISVDGNYFFKDNSVKIQVNSLPLLDAIAKVLNKLPNTCVIEDHTSGFCGCYADLELSMMRSSNIFSYLSKHVPAIKLFPLGYGGIMPFRDNVSPTGSAMDKRVDFVIIDYESRR